MRPYEHRTVRRAADAGKLEFARQQRREPTRSEKELWQQLRRDALGVRFRRQQPIGRYVLDFYCARARLAIEIDGPTHEEQQAYDGERDAWLDRQGIRVMRVSDDEVRENLPGVLAKIRSALEADD